MDKIQKLKQEKQYEQYVKEKTPRHNLFLNMCKAFFLGGLICSDKLFIIILNYEIFLPMSAAAGCLCRSSF